MSATQSPIPIHQNLEISSLCAHLLLCVTPTLYPQKGMLMLMLMSSRCTCEQHMYAFQTWQMAAAEHARFTIMAKSLSVAP